MRKSHIERDKRHLRPNGFTCSAASPSCDGIEPAAVVQRAVALSKDVQAWMPPLPWQLLGPPNKQL